jgi:hypothetical protein
MQMTMLSVNPKLGLAITIDLILTIPLIHFLLIRKTKVPNTTVIPVLLLGVLLGSLFLPEAQQSYLGMFKSQVLPFIELFVLGYMMFKVRKTRLAFKKEMGTTPDFYTALQRTCQEILPKPLVIPFTTEIAVMYYGLIRWRRKTLQANEFSYHKNSGSMALLIAFIFMIAIETVAVHLLLARWSLLAAWILSALSIYTGFQVLGFAKALAQRPIAINEKTLILRYGIMSEATIQLNNIVGVELSNKPVKDIVGAKQLSPLGELESHNLIISVKEEVILKGLYGIKRPFTRIALYADEPQLLKDYIAQQQKRI